MNADQQTLLQDRRLALVEHHAILLAADGYSIRQIADQLGLGEPHIAALLRQTKPCPTPGCGQPKSSSGPAPRGWVQVKAAGSKTWFCTADCAVRWLRGTYRPSDPGKDT